jgi:hypothetical protein
VHERRREGWANGKHVEQWINTLRDHAFPQIGGKLVSEITFGSPSRRRRVVCASGSAPCSNGHASPVTATALIPPMPSAPASRGNRQRVRLGHLVPLSDGWDLADELPDGVRVKVLQQMVAVAPA